MLLGQYQRTLLQMFWLIKRITLLQMLWLIKRHTRLQMLLGQYQRILLQMLWLIKMYISLAKNVYGSTGPRYDGETILQGAGH